MFSWKFFFKKIRESIKHLNGKLKMINITKTVFPQGRPRVQKYEKYLNLPGECAKTSGKRFLFEKGKAGIYGFRQMFTNYKTGKRPRTYFFGKKKKHTQKKQKKNTEVNTKFKS